LCAPRIRRDELGRLRFCRNVVRGAAVSV